MQLKDEHNQFTPIVSVDSIRFYISRDKFTWKALTYKYKKLEGYHCERIINGSEINFHIRREAFKKNFLIIKCVRGNYGKAADYVRVYIDLHLNSFLYQCFSDPYVKSQNVIKELQFLIRHYTNLKFTHIDRLRISRVDIACDIWLTEQLSHYLELIYNIDFPYYILHKNQGNSTLSLHSRVDIDQINSEKDTKRLAVVYHKDKHLQEVHDIELPNNVMRIEFKYEGKKKNQNIEIVDGGDLMGIKKFSDIFEANISKALFDAILSKWLLKYESIDLQDLKSRKFNSRARKYLTRFSNQDQYYQEYLQLKSDNESTSKQKSKLSRDFKNYKECKFIIEAEKKFESGIKYDLYNELCAKIKRLNASQCNPEAINTYRILQSFIEYP